MRARLAFGTTAFLVLLTACGGGGGGGHAEPTSTATPAATASTRVPNTPFPSTPSAPYTGPAHQLGRDDCPSDWLAWVSRPTGFSICYPPSWKQYTGYPWYAQTGITFPQAGSLDAARVSVSYLTNPLTDLWSECDKPESISLLGHAAKLCVWENGVLPEGGDHRPWIVEAYGYYIPYGDYSLAVTIILLDLLRPDAGPECFFTPPAGFRGGAFVPPESCMSHSYDPEAKAAAFDIFETLRGP